IKTFDPDAQRTDQPRAAAGAGANPRGAVASREVAEVWLSPAREAVLTVTNVERARQRVRALSDAIDWPSSKARALVDDVAYGRSFFGSEGFLPAYVDLESLASYLPPDAIALLEDPAAITRALRDELGRAGADE